MTNYWVILYWIPSILITMRVKGAYKRFHLIFFNRNWHTTGTNVWENVYWIWNINVHTMIKNIIFCVIINSCNNCQKGIKSFSHTKLIYLPENQVSALCWKLFWCLLDLYREFRSVVILSFGDIRPMLLVLHTPIYYPSPINDDHSLQKLVFDGFERYFQLEGNL